MLHPDSCAVARIALVKPDKARGVEDVVLRAAQMGQIVEKVACFCYHHITFHHTGLLKPTCADSQAFNFLAFIIGI